MVSFDLMSNDISEVNEEEMDSAECVPSFRRIIDIPPLTLFISIIRVYARAMVRHASVSDVQVFESSPALLR